METPLHPREADLLDEARVAAANHIVLLQCPCCRADTEGYVCPKCDFQFKNCNGIIQALAPERRTYYERFIQEYELIRTAEGRGSQLESFYLSLPYRDITGRNNAQWKIRSRSYKCLIKHVLKPLRSRGLVLDLGAGNCWMSYRLTNAGYTPIAIDLLTNKQDGLGAATHFNRHLSAPILRFQAELSRLPFSKEQFDAVIFNASFHYAEDYELTLREALRCLRPGGLVVISDTPSYSREESGRQMIAEKHTAFLQRFGTASDSVKSLEYLTKKRLCNLEQALSIQWAVHRPWHGWKWAMRPWMARLRGRREPARFRIYSARKNA